MTTRITQTSRALGLATVFAAFAALAAPKADLWPKWQAHDAQSTTIVDHSAWSELLAAHISAGPDGVNLFDYAGIDSAERSKLDGYVRSLTGTNPATLNRNEQKAYWINLYNAVTVQVVLDAYPVDSITDIDISPGFFANGPWDKKLVTIDGSELSLNDIEHRILRPIWDDPLIHYGVNCASISCPNLRDAAYEGDTVDEQLAQNAHDYVNTNRAARLKGSKLIVSSIYEWYQVDFGDSERGVIEHLRQYANAETKAKLEGRSGYRDDDYNWDLNAR